MAKPMARSLTPPTILARSCSRADALLTPECQSGHELPTRELCGANLRTALATRVDNNTLASIHMKTKALLKTLCLLGAASSLWADVVTDWNNAALNAIRTDKTPPPKASRALAILHASIYDAVNGIDRSFEPYFVASAVPASASKEAAAATAGHD